MVLTKNIPAYYFPTKVFLVDDNKDFLMNFSLQLEPNLAYSLFESPHEALRYLLQDNKVSQLNQHVFSDQNDGNEFSMTSQTIKLDISEIHKEIFDQHRFEEVSVIIVDYDMPGLDGLELCHRLKERPVKKILLTGKADEKLAISAFNDGLIDHFIQKSDPNIVSQINESIAVLQKQYFLDATKIITKLLRMDATGFMRDTIFIELFNKICQDNNIVEYYLTENTGSFLMLDAQAKPSWLVTKYYDDLKIHYEIAENNHAPVEVLEALRSGDKLPYTWNTKDYFSANSRDWSKQLHSAEELSGKDTYYYAYIKELDSFDVKKGEILSYAEYLRQADINSI